MIAHGNLFSFATTTTRPCVSKSFSDKQNYDKYKATTNEAIMQEATMFGLKTGSRYSGSVVACPALQIIVYQRFDLTENVIQIRDTVCQSEKGQV